MVEARYEHKAERLPRPTFPLSQCSGPLSTLQLERAAFRIEEISLSLSTRRVEYFAPWPLYSNLINNAQLGVLSFKNGGLESQSHFPSWRQWEEKAKGSQWAGGEETKRPGKLVPLAPWWHHNQVMFFLMCLKIFGLNMVLWQGPVVRGRWVGIKGAAQPPTSLALALPICEMPHGICVKVLCDLFTSSDSWYH